eukprot:403354284
MDGLFNQLSSHEISSPTSLTDAEKRKLRLQRFGNSNAQNPNLTTQDALKMQNEELQKRLERAKKFGLEDSSKDCQKLKLQQRAERFGIKQGKTKHISKNNATISNNGTNDLSKNRSIILNHKDDCDSDQHKALLEKRKERFGIVTQKDQKKQELENKLKRKERFQKDQTSTTFSSNRTVIKRVNA